MFLIVKKIYILSIAFRVWGGRVGESIGHNGKIFVFYFQPDEDLFNPDYIEVDRVLEIAITTDTETGEVR